MDNNTSSPSQKKSQNLTVSDGDKKCEALPDFFTNIKSLVQHCHSNQLELDSNTNFTDGSEFLDGRSKQYIAGKKSIMKKFFEIMSKHSIFRHFCKVVPDPDFENRELPLFFSTFRGPKTEDKKYLFNKIMFHFAINMKKKGYEKVNLLDEKFTQQHATACYQPNSMNSRLKELFA